MKAPLRATNSSTIEKLRVWLAAELEPLEINNNIQYAHHVVTIFLNDADVEDEPVSPPDDYLRELDNLRAGKSLDQKKKAAVQFLKGVIPFENQPIQCLIEQLIEELVERVDATRVKTPKKVLCPINVNVEITRRLCGYKKNRMEQESFEEAFPSLPAETRMSAVTVTIKKDVSADGWAKSTSVSDSNQRNKKRSTATRRITFVDKSEDAVCSKTGLLHLLPLPDTQPSPVTIQVDESSFQTGIFSGGAIQLHYEAEWKSAFMKVKPTATLYSPKKFRFPVPQVVSLAGPKSLQHVTVLRHDGLNEPVTAIRTLARKVDLLNESSPKVFLHMEKRAPEILPCALFALDADDLEVSNVISWSSINSEQLKRRRNELVQKKRLEAQVVRASRKERKDSSRQSQASQGNSSDSSRQRDGEGPLSSPLVGAVGGCEEVKTDDLLGFAMTQMANFEKNRSGTGGYGNRQDAFEGGGNALAIPIPIGGGRAGGGEDDGYGRDSGMVAGGEDDSWRRNLLGWANGGDASSYSLWSEPSTLWLQDPAPAPTAPWRKTPGGAGPGEDDAERQGRVSPLQANGSAVMNGAAEESGGQAHQDRSWDGWRDPWSQSPWSQSVSGPSWDSMIWGDVCGMSTSPPASNAVATTIVDDDNINTPPELSSCVDDNVSQILQSAFVNSMFAQASPSDPMGQIPGSPKVLDCSELEQSWLFNGSDEALPMTSRSRFLNVVKGKTCSNFLEGICRLGSECPFSHPSI